jgi:hypothetical protein
MNKSIFLGLFLLFANYFVAQTNREHIKKAGLAKTYEPVQSKASAAENSNYFGLDNKIKEILLKDASMEKVPVRKENQTKNEYVVILNEWIKNNPGLLKPDKTSTEIN